MRPIQSFGADESKRLIYVNNAACESLGYSREELLQLTVPDISARHDSARFSDRWKIMADGGSAHYESTHRHKDGHLFPIKVSLNRLSIGDENYTCAIIRDFTQLEKARVDLENSERIKQAMNGYCVHCQSSIVST